MKPTFATRLIRKAKILGKILSGESRALCTRSRYCIKRGYRHRNRGCYFDDTSLRDEWQNEVYEAAHSLAMARNYRKVLDIGCGSAFKLLKFFNDFDIIGVDVRETVGFLRAKYPQGTWLEVNEFNSAELKVDLVICSDVIEHVMDPDDLMAQIKRVEFETLIISTPERDIWAGQYDFGPPANPSHLREWNGRELRSYISSHFPVVRHQVTNYEQATQMIICNKP